MKYSIKNTKTNNNDCKYDKFFKLVEKSVWFDNTEKNVVIKQANKAFEELVAGKTKQAKLYRFCGQSGSGKTSQLLSSTLKILEENKINPVVIAVRNFAHFHPDYDKLLAKFGKSEIREKTNAFALKCLFVVLEKCLKDGYYIALDVTILDKNFETEFVSLFIKYNYEVAYQILSVSKPQSNRFIEKREKDKNNFEYGRKIYTSSKDYFYSALRSGLRTTIKLLPNIRTIVWSAYNAEPVYDGKMKDCYLHFAKHRKITKKVVHTSEEMCTFKYNYLTKHLAVK